VPVPVAKETMHDHPLRGRPQATVAKQLGELGVVAGRGVVGRRGHPE
jgi:hypothetical protein